MIAGRYLRARRKDTFISVIASLTLVGVAIGVATLIVVTSVMNGFREELLSKILGLNGHFTVYPIESKFADYEDAVAAWERVAGVTHAVAFVEGEALASGFGGSTGVSVRGMSLADIRKLTLLFQNVAQGGWDDWDDGQGAAIGYRLAQKLGIAVGDAITIVNPNGTVTPFGTTPQIRAYPVNVIFDLGMVEFDSFYVYLPIKAGQVYFKKYQDVLKPGIDELPLDATDEQIAASYDRIYYATAAEIFIKDPDAVDDVRLPLQMAIDQPVILTDWRQRNETFFSALQVERVVMFTILSMIVVVAAFNIISSLVMLVKDKAKDIAVLRTIGATRGAVMRIFCMTGTAIGVAGTLLGLILGLLVAANAESIRAFLSDLIGIRIFPPEVFFLSSLPSRVVMGDVLFITLTSLTLSILATLYPAWRAAQQDPVEALRYE
ncbi:MAG: ABC transporter permease [Alphaproteobacteria bacterium]|nr:ABC transporter permease [Alphaproteobacteria bacterium]